MTVKRKQFSATYYLLPLSLGLCLILGYVVFVHGQRHWDLAQSAPELQEANAIEAAYQALPEAPASPGSVDVPIFIYHSVRPKYQNESETQDAYDIRPELLERQLSYLQDNGYTVISLDQLVSMIETATTSPVAKPVVLTFDDGWENEYKNAFPLLEKHHMTATFFIYTNPIGKKHFMTWDEVKEMDAAGMTIGDHTVSHPYLKGLPLDQVKKEITDGKKIIEQHLGKSIYHFASPFGYTNPQIMSIVQAAGFKTGRTTLKGTYNSKADLYKLRGILVSDSMSDFIAELHK